MAARHNGITALFDPGWRGWRVKSSVLRVTAAGAANRFHFVENGRPVARNSRPLTCSKGTKSSPELNIYADYNHLS